MCVKFHFKILLTYLIRKKNSYRISAYIVGIGKKMKECVKTYTSSNIYLHENSLIK